MMNFENIAKEHGPLIRRIARSYERNQARADELVQDVLVAIWQALPRFRGDASVRTFVARIAHNRAITHVTREAREPRTLLLSDTLPAHTPTPEENLTQQDLRAKLEQSVHRLPLSLRMVATLSLEGFSPDEIANVLGLNVSATSVRLHRAKELLKEMLKGSDK